MRKSSRIKFKENLDSIKDDKKSVVNCVGETLFPWVGNKKFYLNFIESHLPPKWNKDKHMYIEPFLGSAIVFTFIRPKKAIISDNSAYLMDIFKCMKSNSPKLYDEVKKLYDSNGKETHSTVKNVICSTRSKYARSAMFWYLLKTSLYSFVCPKADGTAFTCCYKSTGKPIQMKDALFYDTCKLLQQPQVQVLNSDFEELLNKAKKGDFLFIDPPYMNLKRPSRKIYNSFTQADHERLVKRVIEAHKRGCYIMMFNHDHPYLKENLTDFLVIPVEHTKFRKTRSHFATYKEVMFRNY
jgi:DNA adenine methylase